jgi:hypothetical protein
LKDENPYPNGEQEGWNAKVGDIGNELDVEFDDHIQDNLQMRESNIEAKGGHEEDEEDQVDHNEVDLIEEGSDYHDHSKQQYQQHHQEMPDFHHDQMAHP